MKYKVVRTYPSNYYGSNDELEKCFKEGWQYKVCHEIKNKDG